MIEGAAGKLAFPRLAPAAARASTSGGERVLLSVRPSDLAELPVSHPGSCKGASLLRTRIPGGINLVHPLS
ncbi:hypothetical protein ES703_61461 [subsurface metagenome]